jgi:hypothetical protein
MHIRQDTHHFFRIAWRRKSSGSGSSKSSAINGSGFFDARRPQVGFARRKIQAASLRVGHQIEDRATVARHHDGFAALDLASQLSEPLLGLPDRHGLHRLNMATRSHPVKIRSVLALILCSASGDIRE